MKYSSLAKIYDALESTSKRLEKTYMISVLLKDTHEDDIDQIILLLQGRVFPLWDETKLGVSERLVIKAITTATGTPGEKIEKEWKSIGDLGRVAEKLVEKKSQATLFSKDLTVKKVFDNIKTLAGIEGQGSVDHKVKMIAELLSSAKPIEARYVVRTVLEDLRVGVGTGSIRDAIVWAYFGDQAKINYDDEKKSIDPENREEYKRLVDSVQRAFDLKADFGEVARLIMKDGEKAFEELALSAGKPVNVMLYQKAKGMEDAFERVGTPAALEYKYDGFRMEIHKDKKDGKITIYTRRMEDVSKQFPEVVGFVKDYVEADSFILDGEAVGFNPKTSKYLPFQSISQRIRRKYDIDKMAKEFPVELNVFDVLFLNGKDMLNVPYKERRAEIKRIVKAKPKELVVARQIVTSDINEAGEFYEEALAASQEGVMVKNLDGVYQPGSRVGFGVKVKPVMESLDLVVVGGEWGTGKRSGWITSLVLACRKGDDFLEIGRVGTGLKELPEEGLSFGEVTELLKSLIEEQKGRDVKIKPSVILEINFEEIQKSPSYSSGYALRFPRVIRLRDDKGLKDVSDLGLVEELYFTQRAR
ncbi:ATP-dependent DNA ligase [Candidatus Woesearchaeota archaeon]|nr:ATP-dependent DNA ligase [Candidatus Woesearchaeota archaeon]